MLPAIEYDFGFASWHTGFVWWCYCIGILLGVVVSAFCANIPKTVVISVCGTGLAIGNLISSCAIGFWSICISRIISGISSSVIIIVFLSYLWNEQDQTLKKECTTYFFILQPLAVCMSYFFSGLISYYIHWRIVYLSWISIFLTLSWMVSLVNEPRNIPQESSSVKDVVRFTEEEIQMLSMDKKSVQMDDSALMFFKETCMLFSSLKFTACLFACSSLAFTLSSLNYWSLTVIRYFCSSDYSMATIIVASLALLISIPVIWKSVSIFEYIYNNVSKILFASTIVRPSKHSSSSCVEVVDILDIPSSCELRSKSTSLAILSFLCFLSIQTCVFFPWYPIVSVSVLCFFVSLLKVPSYQMLFECSFMDDSVNCLSSHVIAAWFFGCFFLGDFISPTLFSLVMHRNSEWLAILLISLGFLWATCWYFLLSSFFMKDSELKNILYSLTPIFVMFYLCFCIFVMVLEFHLFVGAMTIAFPEF